MAIRQSVRALGSCAAWLGLGSLTVALWAGTYWVVLSAAAPFAQ